MNTITASTARPAAKRSLRLLAGLTLAAASLMGALSTNASAAEASAPAPAVTVVNTPAKSVPTAPAGGRIETGQGTGAERVNPKALYWVQRWYAVAYDPYLQYFNYYRNLCRSTAYPAAWRLTATAGSVRTYRCYVLTRY